MPDYEEMGAGRRPMRSVPGPNAYAANRIERVGRQTGNRGMRNTQGTTKNIWDTLDLATSGSTLNFFENLSNKGFPWTNLNQNKFSDLESMTIQRAYFTIITNPTGTQSYVYTAGQLDLPQTVEESAYPEIALGQLSILVSGSQILKQFSSTSFYAPFNYKAKFYGMTYNGQQDGYVPRGHSVYDFEAEPVIPPNRDFVATLQVPLFVAPSAGRAYCRLTLEGFGSLPSTNQGY